MNRVLELALKFIKFCFVGASGVVVDFSVTYLLKDRAGWNKYVANSLGFLCAASSNWILNRLWTFQDTNPEVLVQYSKFVAISLIGLGLNNLVVFLLHSRMSWGFYTAKIGAVLAVTLWNFTANYLYTFR